jgi:hypothetical protein
MAARPLGSGSRASKSSLPNAWQRYNSEIISSRQGSKNERRANSDEGRSRALCRLVADLLLTESYPRIVITSIGPSPTLSEHAVPVMSDVRVIEVYKHRQTRSFVLISKMSHRDCGHK